ncbi:unnamed protein product [Adineta ricciae]|uniref:Nicotianamine synthase n=1 Tax=Adineta ricciae TaxID=249248 RepID=A0A816DXE3_ADIRI|nr:unnamed protein product [Adineta ricciae]CAF1638606.1 unnamed protein product [Adineta ricciae]
MELIATSNSIRETLIDYNKAISQLSLFNPSSEATKLFDELLKFCCSTALDPSIFERMLETDLVLQAVCDQLRRSRSQYEYYLEQNLAKIYTTNPGLNLIEQFSDDGDYHRLIEFEINMLHELGIRFSQSSIPNDTSNILVNKIAFIGSGPIPISSILILRKYAPFADIYNIDVSHEANQLALSITKQLLPGHLIERMHFITQDIGQKSIPIEVESILKECEIIFLAALVGHDEMTKLDILRNVVKHSKNESNLTKVQHIVIRSTDGLCQVLYPKLSPELIITLEASSSNETRNNKQNISLDIRKVSLSENGSAISTIIAKMIKK